MKEEDIDKLCQQQAKAEEAINSLKKALDVVKKREQASQSKIQELEEKIAQVEQAIALGKDVSFSKITSHHFKQYQILDWLERECWSLQQHGIVVGENLLGSITASLHDYTATLRNHLFDSANEAFWVAAQSRSDTLEFSRQRKIEAVRGKYNIGMDNAAYLKLKDEIELIDYQYQTIKDMLGQDYAKLPEPAVHPLSAFIDREFLGALEKIEKLNDAFLEQEKNLSLDPKTKAFLNFFHESILRVQDLSRELSKKECAKQNTMDDNRVQELSEFIAYAGFLLRLMITMNSLSASVADKNSGLAAMRQIAGNYRSMVNDIAGGQEYEVMNRFYQDLWKRYLSDDNPISRKCEELVIELNKKEHALRESSMDVQTSDTPTPQLISRRNTTPTPAEPMVATQPQRTGSASTVNANPAVANQSQNTVDRVSTVNPVVVNAPQKSETDSKSNTPAPASTNTAQTTNGTQTQQTAGPVNAVDQTLVKEVIDVIRKQRAHRPKMMQFLARLGLNLRRTKDGLTKGFTQFLESKTTIQKDELNYYLERFKMAQQSLEQNRPNKELEEQSIKDLLAYITTDSKDTTLLSFRSKKEELGILSLRSRHGFDKEERRYQEVMSKFKPKA